MYKNDEINVNFLKLLSDFVDSSYISEWQAGYISGMLNTIDSLYQDNSFPNGLGSEKIYKQLLNFIWSYMHKEEV